MSGTIHIKTSSQIMDRGRDDGAKAPLINVAELSQYVKRKREQERLSLRAVAKQTRVSASTLSRIENGAGTPSTPTVARLAKWLNIPFERVVTGGNSTGGNSKESPMVYYPPESVPDIVTCRVTCRRSSSHNLTPEQALALAEMFRIAYNQLSAK